MRSIALYNLKGGVGKTTTAVNLAYLASQAGHKVLIWDMDPQGSASFYFQVQAHLKGGVKKLLSSGDRIEKYIRATQYETLDIIPADISERNIDLVLDDMKKSTKRLKMLFEELARSYDLLFVDSHPHLSLLSENLFKAVDYLLVPLIPTVLSLRTFDLLYTHLQDYGIRDGQILPFFSMADRRKNMHKTILENGVEKGIKTLITAVPYASDIEKMGQRMAPLPDYSPRSRTGQVYTALWNELRDIIRF